MRILIAHNRYQQRGGEDQVVAAEAAMLERQGHTVDLLLVDNDAIHGAAAQARAAIDSLYSIQSAHLVTLRIERLRPHILHVHNFLPNLSPSVYFAAAHHRIPVVQTLHNYRLICANAQLYRAGQVCELCPTYGGFVPGIQHACYRGSRLGSAVVGGGIALHAALGTWATRIHRYIALTEFARHKLSQFRIPADNIRVKPNFIAEEAQATPIAPGTGDYALFAGRLSPEKGLQTLIEADALNLLQLPVHIAGDGPMLPQLQAAAARPGSRLHLLGPTPHDRLQALMRQARVLIVPSLWFEGCPMVILEALAAGLPIVASRIGGLPELVDHNVTGQLFTPGSPTALADSLNLFAQPSPTLENMRQAARQRFESTFTEARNYQILMAIYRELVPTT